MNFRDIRLFQLSQEWSLIWLNSTSQRGVMKCTWSRNVFENVTSEINLMKKSNQIKTVCAILQLFVNLMESNKSTPASAKGIVH